MNNIDVLKHVQCKSHNALAIGNALKIYKSNKIKTVKPVLKETMMKGHPRMRGHLLKTMSYLR